MSQLLQADETTGGVLSMMSETNPEHRVARQSDKCLSTCESNLTQPEIDHSPLRGWSRLLNARE